MLIVSKSLEDTRRIARDIAEGIDVEDRAHVIGLSGDLGAGKTAFVQELARVLGVVDRVASPTFVLLKMYETTHKKIDTLIHIDAYRLESGNELSVLGFEEMLREPRTLICVEWHERVQEILPNEYTVVQFDPLNSYTRNVEITYGYQNPKK